MCSIHLKLHKPIYKALFTPKRYSMWYPFTFDLPMQNSLTIVKVKVIISQTFTVKLEPGLFKMLLYTYTYSIYN